MTPWHPTMDHRNLKPIRGHLSGATGRLVGQLGSGLRESYRGEAGPGPRARRPSLSHAQQGSLARVWWVILINKSALPKKAGSILAIVEAEHGAFSAVNAATALHREDTPGLVAQTGNGRSPGANTVFDRHSHVCRHGRTLTRGGEYVLGAGNARVAG